MYKNIQMYARNTILGIGARITLAQALLTNLALKQGFQLVESNDRYTIYQKKNTIYFRMFNDGCFVLENIKKPNYSYRLGQHFLRAPDMKETNSMYATLLGTPDSINPSLIYIAECMGDEADEWDLDVNVVKDYKGFRKFFKKAVKTLMNLEDVKVSSGDD
jgi:hypothetical protein